MDKLNKSASDKHEHKHNMLKVWARTGIEKAQHEQAVCMSYRLLKMALPNHKFICVVTLWGTLVLEVGGELACYGQTQQ